MAEIVWSDAKNAELKQRYGFGFERVVVALGEDGLIDERAHPNPALWAPKTACVAFRRLRLDRAFRG